MKKRHFQLYDAFLGLGISFAVTILSGIVIALVLEEGTRFNMPFWGILSFACTATTGISYAIWALVSGIQSQQWLRFYHLGGLGRKKAFWMHWRYSLIALASASVVITLLASGILAMTGAPLFGLLMLLGCVALIVTGLALMAIGQLFGFMALAIPHKVAAGFAIAAVVIFIANLASDEFIFLIIAGIIAFIVNMILYAKRRCPLKSTAIS